MSAFRYLCAALLALAIFTSHPAAAQEAVTATDPESVAEVIRDKGFDVSVTKDGDGDPMLTAEGKGYSFLVFFYGCTAHRDCQTISLQAYWAEGTSDVAKINAWNRDNRFGRAFVDKDGDPNIAMEVDLDDGGMPRILFEDNVEFWMSVMSQFAKFVLD